MGQLADDVLADLDRIRRATIARGDPWPDTTARNMGNPDSPECGMTWRGKARMAHARKAAGLPLDAHDRLALTRSPTCPTLLP